MENSRLLRTHLTPSVCTLSTNYLMILTTTNDSKYSLWYHQKLGHRNFKNHLSKSIKGFFCGFVCIASLLALMCVFRTYFISNFGFSKSHFFYAFWIKNKLLYSITSVRLCNFLLGAFDQVPSLCDCNTDGDQDKHLPVRQRQFSKPK